MSIHRPLAIAAGVALVLSFASKTRADYNLGFTSLPSAQSWTYGPFGDRAGIPESAIYSISGGVLHEDTLGRPTVSGGSAEYSTIFTPSYIIPGTSIKIDPTLPFDITVNARVTATIFAPGDNPYGLDFGIILNNKQYAVGLTNMTYGIEGPGGPNDNAGGAFDNTDYHTYTIQVLSTGKFNLVIDGSTVRSDLTPFALDPTAPRFFLGVGTGFTDVSGDIRRYSFIQPVGSSSSVPEPGSITLLLAISAAGVACLRRRARK
jgi:hypothetical protein